MSFLEEIREEPLHIFSKLEAEVLEYLERHPWGGTIHQIARDVKCSFKSLYSVLGMLEKNGWIMTVKERNGGIGRPRNRYILRQSLSTIIRKLHDCGCRFDDRTKFLNLSEVSYPYSLTIFKRALAKVNYGECLVILLGDTANLREFEELASKKDIRVVDILTNSHNIRVIFKKG
ncbi:MAG: hypothetical protein QXF28_03285 [Nitrososphaerota archaeon]